MLPVIETIWVKADIAASGSVPSATPTQFHRSVSVAVSTSGIPRELLTCRHGADSCAGSAGGGGGGGGGDGGADTTTECTTLLNDEGRATLIATCLPSGDITTMPTKCSHACADVLVPLYSSCGTVMQTMVPGIDSFASVCQATQGH